MSICIMASLGVQSTVDGFGESSNSPTALNVHHGHQAAGGSRSDPMFAFAMAAISFFFFLWRKPFQKTQCSKAALLSLYVIQKKFVRSQCIHQLPLWGNQTCFFVDGGKKLEHMEETQANMGRKCRVQKERSLVAKGGVEPRAAKLATIASYQACYFLSLHKSCKVSLHFWSPCLHGAAVRWNRVKQDHSYPLKTNAGECHSEIHHKSSS